MKLYLFLLFLRFSSPVIGASVLVLWSFISCWTGGIFLFWVLADAWVELESVVAEADCGYLVEHSCGSEKLLCHSG
jgi:hypothetical protein